MTITDTPTTAASPTTGRPFTGDEYLESLRDDREVWIYGERVKDVTTHPAFRNSARMVARLYDGLHDPEKQGVLTVPTDTGNGGRTHAFFRTARSSDDLVKGRDAIAEWARMSYGWMGRSPDYKATFLATLDVNEEYYHPFEANAKRWYRESQEKVLFWNHAIINPPVDRHLSEQAVEDVFVHATKETDAGLYVTGAKVVATGAAITHMNFIASVGAPVRDRNYALIAGIPMDAPGVKLIARTSYAVQAAVVGSPYDYPLSSRMDENDAVLVLDNVFIPWENVFLWGDVEKLSQFQWEAGMDGRVALQGTTRLAVKLDFIAGLLMKSLEITGTKDFRGVQSRIGEVLAYRAMLWSLTDSMVHEPEKWKKGAVQPGFNGTNAQRWLSQVAYPRVREIVEQDLGSALIYLNSHAIDFQTPEIRPYLDKYLRGSNGIDAVQRVKVLKMMWDAVGTEFGGRHDLYERNYQGGHEIVRLASLWHAQHHGLDKELIAFADKALDEYDLDGWTAPDLIGNDDVTIIGKNMLQK